MIDIPTIRSPFRLSHAAIVSSVNLPVNRKRFPTPFILQLACRTNHRDIFIPVGILLSHGPQVAYGCFE